jgi:large subunit ribosomal protein L5
MAVTDPRIQKVTVHMAVGESGELLQKASKLLEELTGQKPVQRMAKKTNRDFGIRKGEPISTMVTLRGEPAEVFLRRALEALENKVSARTFDTYGNFSFGIREHIDLPGVRYDPAVGIFGMDVCVTLERIGYRISRRKLFKKAVHPSHRLTKDQGIEFIMNKFGGDIA